MKTFSFIFTHLPPVTKRGSQVLVALFSNDRKKIYLSRKNVYPAGIYRLFGGGIESYEDPLTAAPRELFEETKLHINASNLIAIDIFTYNLTESSTQQNEVFTIHLFKTVLPPNTEIIPSDDVDEYKGFTKDELSTLINTYKVLSTEMVTNTVGGGFRWSDYGKVFAPVHQIVFDSWEY
jgi:8-oxo-dGTP pyrophosphatase MutT (NUDIX family)